MYRILLVDSDCSNLDKVACYLTSQGHKVLRAETGAAAMALVRQVSLDCVVLEADLPDVDGFFVCRQIREFSGIPILFLSHLMEEADRVRGLTVGGDDYICKPFSMAELVQRIALRVNSRSNRPAEILTLNSLTVDTARRTVRCGERWGSFTCIEFDILSFLVKNPDRVFSYEQLYDAIWNEPIGMSRHNLQARVAMIRQKLSALCPGTDYIRTVRRKGYALVTPQADAPERQCSGRHCVSAAPERVPNFA